jgi:hypothetical protein
MDTLPYKRLTVEENPAPARPERNHDADLVALSNLAVQTSWVTIARAHGVLEGNDRLRAQRIADEVAAELADLTRRSALLHDDGSMLAMIVARLALRNRIALAGGRLQRRDRASA